VNDVWIMGDFDVAYMTGRKRRPERREFHGRGYVAWVSTGLREGERRIKERANRDLGIRLRDAGMTEWDYWGPEVVEATERLRTFDAEHADGPQQADHLEDEFGADRHHWMIHWLLNFWDGIGPYQKAVEAVTGLTGQAAEHIATRLAEGEESWHSRMIDGLYELALLARDVPALVALIAELPVNARDRLDALPEARTFLVRLDLYLDDFGDHTGSGAGSDPSILRPTWREDCALVLSLVAPYLDSRTPAPSEVRARRLRERDIELRNVCGRCSDPEKVAELRRWLPLARKRAGVLEAHNYYIDQMSLGQLRGAIMAAGTWLAEHGALQTAGDVFWLRRDEVGQALKAATPPSFATLIAERQRQREEWSQLQPPEIMGVPDPVLDPRPPLKDEVEEQQPVGNHLLKGQAASAGRYRGRARVVTETRGIPVVAAGDVLVAEQAGPMWTPLFPVLGALVLDNAALTQHAATTAREYRIPTVINTRSAILRIPDGAWVTVDGDDGTVEVEES
jgi:phosphohistidine swiveling domain-containing protein